MERMISPDDERTMVRAIEKAAALATADDTLDRSRVLADCLLEADVPLRFSKVASDGFNRRVTVVTFRNTSDDHKADTFRLSDADQVREMMGGEPAQRKEASAAPRAFSARLLSRELPLEKAASAGPSRPNVEDTMDAASHARRLEAMLDKQAAAMSHQLSELWNRQGDVSRRKQTMARELGRLDKFAFRTLCNACGERLGRVMSDAMPDADFSVTGQAVPPSGALFGKVARLLDDSDSLDALESGVAEYARGLDEFAQSVGREGAAMRKRALLEDTGALMGHAIEGISNLVPHSLKSLRDLGAATIDAGSKGIDYADSFRPGPASAAPTDILSPEFIARDRYRDRMLGWSDMTADPLLSMYPSEQVFLATQKAMDMNSNLERPDRREQLRGQVAALLAQNNRASLADLGALNTILAEQAKAAPSAAAEAYADARSLDDVRAPERGMSPAIMDVFEKVPEGSNDAAARLGKMGDKYDKLKEKEQKDKADAAKSQKELEAKRVKDLADRDANEKKQRADRAKAYIDFLKSNNLRIAVGPSGELVLASTGSKKGQINFLTPSRQKQYEDAFAAYYDK